MPRSVAFFATIPAAIITAGFEVLVHDVMAAIRTSPFPTDVLSPLGALVSIATRSGVGRLLIISTSVVTLVFRSLTESLSIGSGTDFEL
jgi:hypothetical protein